jgi:energy-coupling factor transporter ATP-binding protein EcfA2
VIRFERVSFRYSGETAATLHDVDFEVGAGELALVIGRTGAGKSTLLRCVNGLAPHFTGGRLQGRVLVDGRDTATHKPRDLADVVGYVGQDPAAGFVTDTVEDELAYTMESLRIAPPVMRRRVEEVLDLLGLADVRDRPLLSLSAGQQQRVAIGAVLTAQPRTLVLDEPTSALDPAAAEEVLAAVTRMVHDVGLTVLLAEHRLERVLQYADVALLVEDDGTVRYGRPADIVDHAPSVPPVVELARLAGWSPPPLSVRDARRLAAGLRDRVGSAPPLPAAASAAPVAEVAGVSVAYAGVRALRDVSIRFNVGEVVAVMGRNGAGKSTLLGVIAGIVDPQSGRATVEGCDLARLRANEAVRHVALVPHNPVDLLLEQSVEAECAAADDDHRVAAGTTRSTLDRLLPGVPGGAHPRDLSEGQRLVLALAVVLGSDTSVVALDEPTRGLDYRAKQILVDILRRLAAEGHCVIAATHDVELAALVADRVVVLAGGEVVTDGPARAVLTSSPVFAPQVAKVLAPEPFLTVDDVRRALQ